MNLIDIRIIDPTIGATQNIQIWFMKYHTLKRSIDDGKYVRFMIPFFDNLRLHKLLEVFLYTDSAVSNAIG